MTFWFCMSIAAALGWWRQTKTQNATSADLFWVMSLGLSAWFTQEFLHSRSLVGAILLSLWAFRLGSHLVKDRLIKHQEEDGRYQDLRKRWGSKASRNFFLLYQAQVLLAYLFSIAATSVSSYTGIFDWMDGAAIFIAILAIGGEGLADFQLAKFRQQKSGGICEIGLWKWSRHPNYFFEWVFWWNFVLLSRGDLKSFLGPALMGLFLWKLSGISISEARMLKNKPGYVDYQHRVSAFVPWFRRSPRVE